MKGRAEHPRSCAASQKRIYETKDKATEAGMRVMLLRQKDVYVYPCALGGFHISTVAGRRCG